MRWLLLTFLLVSCSVAEAQTPRRTYLPLAARDAAPTAYTVGIGVDPRGAVCVRDESTTVAGSLVGPDGRLVGGAALTFQYVYPAASGSYEAMNAGAVTDADGAASVRFPVRGVVYDPGGGDAIGFRVYHTAGGTTYASRAVALRLVDCAQAAGYRPPQN